MPQLLNIQFSCGKYNSDIQHTTFQLKTSRYQLKVYRKIIQKVYRGIVGQRLPGNHNWDSMPICHNSCSFISSFGMTTSGIEFCDMN